MCCQIYEFKFWPQNQIVVRIFFYFYPSACLYVCLLTLIFPKLAFCPYKFQWSYLVCLLLRSSSFRWHHCWPKISGDIVFCNHLFFCWQWFTKDRRDVVLSKPGYCSSWNYIKNIQSMWVYNIQLFHRCSGNIQNCCSEVKGMTVEPLVEAVKIPCPVI